jgi:hypothetical protein
MQQLVLQVNCSHVVVIISDKQRLHSLLAFLTNPHVIQCGMLTLFVEAMELFTHTVLQLPICKVES